MSIHWLKHSLGMFCKSKGVVLVVRFRQDMLFTIHNREKGLAPANRSDIALQSAAMLQESSPMGMPAPQLVNDANVERGAASASKKTTPPLPAHLHPSHRRDAINVLYWKCEACKQNTFAILIAIRKKKKKVCTRCSI